MWDVSFFVLILMSQTLIILMQEWEEELCDNSDNLVLRLDLWQQTLPHRQQRQEAGAVVSWHRSQGGHDQSGGECDSRGLSWPAAGEWRIRGGSWSGDWQCVDTDLEHWSRVETTLSGQRSPLHCHQTHVQTRDQTLDPGQLQRRHLRQNPEYQPLRSCCCWE